MNWIQSVLMGFASGLCELMPLSAQAHRGLLSHFFDIDPMDPLFLLLCHGAILIVLLSAGRLELGRLYRTSKRLRTSSRRHSGQPDRNSAGTMRLLRTAALVAVIGQVLSVHFQFVALRLWLLVVPLLLSGLLLFVSSRMRTANKDGRHLSAADGLLIGFGALGGAVPGLSAVGASLAIASMRGVQRQYALRFVWILTAVSLGSAIVMDLLALVGAGGGFELSQVICAALGGFAAGCGSYAAIQIMRALNRPGGNGIGGFCYYNWGMALLCLMLFLLV